MIGVLGGRGGARPSRILAPSNRAKLVVSLAVLTVLSTLATIGTYAAFTASTSTADSAFATGTLSLSNDRSASTLLAISNKIIPGDTVTGYLNVTNSGTEDVVGYQMAVALGSGATSNNLTDGTQANSLKLTVDRCSVAWSAGACAGTTTHVVANQNVLGTFALVSGATPGANAFCTSDPSQTASLRTSRGVVCDSTIDTAGIDHLKVTVSFPSGADNTFQNLSTSLRFTMSGSQGTAVNF